MSKLAPNLFQRRFGDLMEIGRARLRSLAPGWTDHNAHDPGITLMELLAWVSEAEIYSLSRVRRDERLAYAALLGLAPEGTEGARGLIWPDRQDPNSPVATFSKNLVLPEDAVIGLMDAESPTFRPQESLLWVPGRIKTLVTRHGDGRTTDHTRANERGGLVFLPFGERAGRRDVLAMTFECRDEAGLLGTNRQNAKAARWAIGVLAAPALQNGADSTVAPPPVLRPSLTATLVIGDERVALKIASDSSQGLLTTGSLLLDLGAVKNSPREFTIELRSSNGFARPPRLLRIEPNVIPIQQGRTILGELHVANGTPDWAFTLNAPGLRYAMGKEPVTLEVAEPSGLNTWNRCDRLSDRGPNDNVYELDAKTGEVTFGNGVNGRIPPSDSQVLVSYSVSDGEDGGVARNRKWKVAGFPGAYGVNPDQITGGAAAPGGVEQRREARQRSRNDHALVTSEDIAAAAIALPLLEVARAWVASPHQLAPRTGVVTLVALRSRPGGIEPEQIPETARWLDVIRRSLAARMPLGSRLAVTAPRYIEFSIHAVLEADAGRNPSAIQEEIVKELRKRLALVDSGTDVPPRQPGVKLTLRDLAARMRATAGVKRVIGLQLRGADGKSIEQVVVPPNGLPRWNPGRSSIEVKRPETGSPR